ncbi:MAG: hypothetical protein Ta2A_23250 [Treponemataceae bacterium]|nr:MAG: hypothetical protein Ta2A_23250 [Treponemataceae bacterium]
MKFRFFSIFIFLLFWHIAATALNSPLILPLPLDVAANLGAVFTDANSVRHIAKTILRVFLAFIFAFASGSVLGAASALNSYIKDFFVFFLSMVRSIPVVSIILLLIFWFNSDFVPVIAAFLMALPVVTDSVRETMEKLPVRFLDAAKVYGFSRAKTFFYVRLMHAKNAFFSSAKSAFGLCWKVASAAEVLCLPKFALGSALYNAKIALEIDKVFALTILIAALCFLFECLFFDCVPVIVKKVFKYVASRNQGDKEKRIAPNAFEAAPQDAVIEDVIIEHITVSRGKTVALSDFSARFPAFSLTAIMAPTGSGKTTLLDAIAGLIPLDCGMIHNAAKCSYMFQGGELFPWLSVQKNVELVLTHIAHNERARYAQYFLARTKILHKSSCLPNEISGGEKQRAALARSFAYKAPILLMDEAFKSQDAAQKLELFEIMRDMLHKEKRTVILVTHDIEEAKLLQATIVTLPA